MPEGLPVRQVCHIVAETDAYIPVDSVNDAVHRIADRDIVVDYSEVPQDAHFSNNQKSRIRCGDNGVFKSVPVTEEQKLPANIAADLYDTFASDGKYIYDEKQNRPIICQSNAETDVLRQMFPGAVINPRETGPAALMWIPERQTASSAATWVIP